MVFKKKLLIFEALLLEIVILKTKTPETDVRN